MSSFAGHNFVLKRLVWSLTAASAATKHSRSAGPAAGLYGAKITGGGSGGTVCVLGATHSVRLNVVLV